MYFKCMYNRTNVLFNDQIKIVLLFKVHTIGRSRSYLHSCARAPSGFSRLFLQSARVTVSPTTPSTGRQPAYSTGQNG